MREIQASEAKTHLPRLLDDVERGETVTITRHGKAIAYLVPAAQHDKERIRAAIAAIKELRKTTKPMTVDEILSARDEGRK